MQEYQMTVYPADGGEPVKWSGQAICFHDACLLARRAIIPTLGAHDIIGRTYWETTQLTAELPLIGGRKVP